MNKKIMLLEDEEVLGRVYKKKLEQAGFEVEWIKTTMEAEEKAKEFQADVVLIDHGLKGSDKSGMEVMPDIKKLLPKSKIVMLSNYSQFQMEKKAKEAGASGYLVKINTPPAALVTYIKKLLG